MGNCLVTKLKSVVDNDNLEKLGEAVLTITPAAGASQLLDLGAPDAAVTVTGTEGVYFADTLEGLDDPSSRFTSVTVEPGYIRHLYVSNVSGKVMLSSKYNLDRVNNLGILGIADIDALAYSNIFSLVLGNAHGNIDNIIKGSDLSELYISGDVTSTNLNYTNTNLRTLRLASNGVKGSLSDVKSGLQDFRIYSTQITGDISSLAICTGLTQLALNSPNVTGDIETFAAAQVSAGRTSGTCTIACMGTAVEYNGSVVSASYSVTYNSSAPGGYTITQV